MAKIMTFEMKLILVHIKSRKNAILAGGLAGGLAGLVIIVVVLLYCFCKSKREVKLADFKLKQMEEKEKRYADFPKKFAVFYFYFF